MRRSIVPVVLRDAATDFIRCNHDLTAASRIRMRPAVVAGHGP